MFNIYILSDLVFIFYSGKKLWELIEPLNIRIEKLKEYLHDVDPTLVYNVVPIQDIYGPTKDDPKLEVR